MRRPPSNRARAVALATVFCALGVAAGCGRETFDLLPTGVISAGAPAGGAYEAGKAGLGGTAGTSGKGSAGGAGKAESGGGFGGRVTNPATGGGGNPACLGEAGCGDDWPYCNGPSLFCFPCDANADCSPLDAKICDTNQKRCVQCNAEHPCAIGDACHPKTNRCAKACDGNNDACLVDGQHLLCNREFGVCVECFRNSDCTNYGSFNPYCYLNTCVQCIDDRQCSPSQWCFVGRCVKR